MIELPDELRRRYPGAAVRHVLAEPGDNATMRAVASAFVVAALDLYLLAHAELRMEPIPADDENVLAWGIRDGVFVLVWRLSDSAIGAASRIATTTPMATLIVRPDSESRLARKLAKASVDACPSVVGIDSFVSTRVLFSSAELGWGSERTCGELLRIYNQQLRASACTAGASAAVRDVAQCYMIAPGGRAARPA